MSKPFRLIAIGVAVLCAALVAWNFLGPMVKFMVGGGAKALQRPPVTISASPITKAPWTPVVEAVGTARAAQGADIAVQIAGTVKSVNFKPNQHAVKDQLLVQIDDSVEQAGMLAAQANIRLYTVQLQRWQKLYAAGYASSAAGDVAKSQLDIARSDLARLKATADLKAIRAPFDGALGIARVDVGQYVAVGAPLVTLQSVEQIKVDFSVPEQEVSLLAPGLNVHLGTNPDALDYSGHLLGVDPKVDPATRLAMAEAIVDNSQGKISPGQFLRIAVELPPQPDVLQLPQTAIVPSLYGDSVYVATNTPPPSPGGGGRGGRGAGPPPAKGGLFVKQVFIKTGRRVGGKVEILSGLNEGDLIVWAGQNKLQNGTPVAIDNSIDPAKLASSGQEKYR